MVEKTVNKMQYFQHSKQSRSSKLKREEVRSMADKDGEATDSKRDAKAERSEMRDLKSHMQQLEKALRESCRAITEIMCTQPQSKGKASQCFKHLETRQIRTDYPISARQMTKAGSSEDNDGMMVDFKCIYRCSLHWNCFPRRNLRFQKTTY